MRILFTTMITGSAAGLKKQIDEGTFDIDSIDPESGATLLTFATGLAKLDMMGILIDAGAEINARDSKNRTALMLAAEKNKLAALTFLLDHNADPLLERGDGETACDDAYEKGHFDCAQSLAVKIMAMIDSPIALKTENRVIKMAARILASSVTRIISDSAHAGAGAGAGAAESRSPADTRFRPLHRSLATESDSLIAMVALSGVMTESLSNYAMAREIPINAAEKASRKSLLISTGDALMQDLDIAARADKHADLKKKLNQSTEMALLAEVLTVLKKSPARTIHQAVELADTKYPGIRKSLDKHSAVAALLNKEYSREPDDSAGSAPAPGVRR